jgi:hypothetical protein
MEYFSNKERGPKARVEEVISPAVWGGIVALVQSLISTGAFGQQFPEMCPDGAGPVGANEHALSLNLQAEIPDIKWPLDTTVEVRKGYSYDYEPYAPDTLIILDLIQFCYRHVAKPIQRGYHDFFKHYHLGFDTQAGQQEFREKINLVLSRNGLAYDLKDSGDIVRLAPHILGEALGRAIFKTGDPTLDVLLEESRAKFLSPDLRIRRESLERLWDAWERIKTIEDPNDKKRSITELLDKASSEPNLRKLLEDEARTLTNIGNTFQIRHSEIGQIQLTDSRHVDYLFHRLFAMIQLLLKGQRW